MKSKAQQRVDLLSQFMLLVQLSRSFVHAGVCFGLTQVS